MTQDIFAPIAGNDIAKDHLRHMIAAGRIGNSLLFSGCEGIGKSLFAEALAGAVLCVDDTSGVHRNKCKQGVHPDLQQIRPEGKIAMHSIDAMRRLTEQVYLPPSEASRQVFILHDADRMLPTSSNALLKTFEEPAPHSIMILLSSNAQALLPTVRSRCRTVSFRPLPEDVIVVLLQERHGCSKADAIRIAASAQGSIGKAVRILKGEQAVSLDGLFALLAGGRLSSYKQLSDAVSGIAEPFDELKEQLESGIREQMKPAVVMELNAAQREAQQKEVDGVVSLRYREEVNQLLLAILGWYRDLELLHVQGDCRYLIHRERQELLVRALEQGQLRPLHQVESAIAGVKQLIDRSTPLRTCLESLLLKLDYL